MAATKFSDIVASARTTLLELTARYWSDTELFGYALNGAKDLWSAVVDLYKDHFATIDSTNMVLPSGTTGAPVAITGVPVDLFRVLAIQPRVLGDNSSNPGLIFHPRDLTHPDFVQAEAERARQPRYLQLYYAVINAGAPVAAPAIQVVPPVTDPVNLTVKYVPVLSRTLAIGDPHPIPGEADQALIAWTIAWARARERADRSPDPTFIAIYGTEKRKILGVLTPRSQQEPEVVESFFTDYAGYGRGEP